MGFPFKVVAMAFVFLGLGFASFAQSGSGSAQASSRNGFSQEAQAFAADCQTTLNNHDRDFSSNVGPAKGCACLADQIAQTNSSDFAAAGILLAAVVAHPTTPNVSEPDWDAIASDAGISDLKLGELLQASYTAMGNCTAA